MLWGDEKVKLNSNFTEIYGWVDQNVKTTSNPSFVSIHATGGNLAASNAQVTKKWITALPYVANVTSVIHGGKMYICTSSHTSGATTEPGVGTSWATVWTIGYMGASDVSVIATGFDGNLAATDNTLQLVAQRVDDLAVSGLASLPTADNQLMQATGSGTYAWTSTLEGIGSIEATGTLQGRMVFNSYATDTALTADSNNSAVVQLTVAGEATMWDCEAANVGDFVMLWARDAEKIEVVPASGDHFNLFAGTTLTADYELDMAATAGTKVTLMCTADDTWSVYSETAACADGGVAD